MTLLESLPYLQDFNTLTSVKTIRLTLLRSFLVQSWLFSDARIWFRCYWHLCSSKLTLTKISVVKSNLEIPWDFQFRSKSFPDVILHRTNKSPVYWYFRSGSWISLFQGSFIRIKPDKPLFLVQSQNLAFRLSLKRFSIPWLPAALNVAMLKCWNCLWVKIVDAQLSHLDSQSKASSLSPRGSSPFQQTSQELSDHADVFLQVLL
jgi:hypothetical protein